MRKSTPASSGIKIENKLPRFQVQKLGMLKALAGMVANMTTHVATGGLIGGAGVVQDTAEFFDSIRLKTDAGNKLWQLIFRALHSALYELIVDSNGQLNRADIETIQLDEQLEQCLAAGTYEVGPDFFLYPEQSALMQDLRPILAEYLGYFGFSGIRQTNMLARLNSYFIFALKYEWASRYEYYQEIKDILHNPFQSAEDRELSWDTYLSDLALEIEKPIFSESFSLKQVYIPLRACYRKASKKRKGMDTEREFGPNQEKKQPEVVVDLHTHLMAWLEKRDPKDCIRIVRGGPGYGKSSCLKMLAAELAAHRKKVLFIPLHRFDVTGKLDDAIKAFLRFDNYFSHDVIHDERDSLIVLFDGLDELSMQGQALAEVAQSFLREVDKCVSNFNTRELKLQVIISGRDVVVQQNERDFREEGQILRLLPYYIPDEQRVDFEDKGKLLSKDQRNAWWEKYGTVTGKSYKRIPTRLRTAELDEITSQPLLNFLVALSFRRGMVTFDKHTNLNEVYADLLQGVYERGYSENKIHQTVSRMEADHFAAVLQEIALCAWHGKGRTTTVKEINAHFKESRKTKLLKQFISDAEQGVLSLLVAFYFRQAGQNIEGTQTFEFTHKSFGEYLTARKIVQQLRVIHTQFSRSEKEVLGYDGWDIKECLEEWVKVFGKKTLDGDLVRFISNELSLTVKNDTKELQAWQQTIIKLFNYVLQKGMPMESFQGITFYEANKEAIHAERALLILHGLIARRTGELGVIEWGEERGFVAFLSRVSPTRFGSDYFVLRFCNHLKLVNQDLKFCDFISSDLSFSYFSECDFYGSILYRANLQNVNLEFTDLGKADLGKADLGKADLQGANLQGANLRGADLRGADLRGADLQNTILQDANLEGTILDKKRP